MEESCRAAYGQCMKHNLSETELKILAYLRSLNWGVAALNDIAEACGISETDEATRSIGYLYGAGMVEGEIFRDGSKHNGILTAVVRLSHDGETFLRTLEQEKGK